MTEENKAADRRYVEEDLNQGRLEVIDGLRTDDVEGRTCARKDLSRSRSKLRLPRLRGDRTAFGRMNRCNRSMGATNRHPPSKNAHGPRRQTSEEVSIVLRWVCVAFPSTNGQLNSDGCTESGGIADSVEQYRALCHSERPAHLPLRGLAPPPHPVSRDAVSGAM